jgi:hypothetical protein
MNNEALGTRQQIAVDMKKPMPTMTLQNSDRPEGIIQKQKTPAMAVLTRKNPGTNRRTDSIVSA